MSVKITNNTSAPVEVRTTSASPAGPADLADWIDSDYLCRHTELLDELADAADEDIDREIESALVDEVRRSELS